MTRDDYIEPDPRDTEAEAIEREDAADQAIVDRRETMDDPGIWLRPGEYAAAHPAVAMLSTLRHAIDRTQEALGLPSGPLAQADVVYAADRDHALAEAVRAWREVDRREPMDSSQWWDAIRRMRDAADRYAGLAVGQDWRTGGAA